MYKYENLEHTPDGVIGPVTVEGGWIFFWIIPYFLV